MHETQVYFSAILLSFKPVKGTANPEDDKIVMTINTI